MKIRKATADDIPRIKPLYRQIIARLYELAPLYRTDCEQDEEFIKKDDRARKLRNPSSRGGRRAARLRPARGTRDGEARGRRAAALRVPDGHMRRRKAARQWDRERAALRMRRMGARKNLEYLELNVLEANEAARRLYERTGYKKISQRHAHGADVRTGG